MIGLRLELTCDVPENIFVEADATTNIGTSIHISDIEFVANYVKVSPETQQLIDRETGPICNIRTHTWTQTIAINSRAYRYRYYRFNM